MEGLKIDVLNLSSIEWHRNNWRVGAGKSEEKNWPDEISQTPSEVLIKRNGATSAAVSSVHLSFLVKDALYMTLGYDSEEGSFAVELQQLFHLFGIGAQDQWQYWDKSWSGSTTNTSPHTWTFKSCKVVATPTLTNSGGSVSIVISNLPKTVN